MMDKKAGYGLAVLLFGIILATGLKGFAATDPVASAVGKSIGYSMAGQDDAARSLSRVDVSRIHSKLEGLETAPFYLSGVAIEHLDTAGNKRTVKGLLIHQDGCKREIYNRFSADFTGSDRAVVTNVVIEPVQSLKPLTRLYIVPAQKVSVADLDRLSFAQAMEQASMHARKLDDGISGDAKPREYLVAAFVMNRLPSGSQIGLLMDTEPGSLTGMKSARVIEKNGWRIAALTGRFPWNNGREHFFNVVLTQPGGNRRVTAVYTSHSIGRRIQNALTKRGYDPGPVDGRPGARTIQAVKAFQKDMGLHPDGKLTPSLARLLASPELPSAAIVVQRNLSRLGYNIGAIDGVIGPKSKAAIHAFQQKRNLPAQTLITADLICLLSDTVSLPSSSNSVQASGGSGFKPAALKKAERFEARMWPNMATPQ